MPQYLEAPAAGASFISAFPLADLLLLSSDEQERDAERAADGL
jgi:hypothetical protein